MVLIKNWKNKTPQEIDNLFPHNNDLKKYVMLLNDGTVFYYIDMVSVQK